LLAAAKVGLYAYFGVAAAGAQPTRRLLELAEDTHIPLIPAGEAGAFVFMVYIAEHPKPSITTRFTDDAGLHWQVNPDLHLEKLNDRDW
jgi:hypothetical protein